MLTSFVYAERKKLQTVVENKMAIAALLLTFGCLLMSMGGTAANGFSECTAADCVTPYKWYATTVNCVEEVHTSTGDCRWPSGMSSRLDEIFYLGRIAAYQLQWGGGSWSNWFVPGMNDFDPKFNPVAVPCSMPYTVKGLRKAWSYFYDHSHRIIICR